MAGPILVGLIFADRVITEKNEKKGIIGTFTRFLSPQFPVVFPPWAIYAAVTEVDSEEHGFTLELVAEDGGDVVVPVEGKFRVEKRTDVAELGVTVMGAVFPKAGRYKLTFKVDGHEVGTRVLLVDQVPSPGAET